MKVTQDTKCIQNFIFVTQGTFSYFSFHEGEMKTRVAGDEWKLNQKVMLYTQPKNHDPQAYQPDTMHTWQKSNVHGIISSTINFLMDMHTNRHMLIERPWSLCNISHTYLLNILMSQTNTQIRMQLHIHRDLKYGDCRYHPTQIWNKDIT